MTARRDRSLPRRGPHGERALVIGSGADEGCRPVSFLGRALPASFSRRVVVLKPGASLLFDDHEWLGALVVVECGQLDLACRDGGVRHFEQGAVLCLEGLPLVSLHNAGAETVVLVAVTRGRADGG